MTALVGALLLQCSPVIRAETAIAVVTSKNSPLTPLSREEVADLFLGKNRSSHEIPVKPLDNKDSTLRERFYTAAANMSAIRVKAYWSRIVFSGQGRPPQEIASSEVQATLASERDALTYLPVDQVTGDMKILFRIP